MWPQNFEQRLASWNGLRASASEAPLEQALYQINHWWKQTPWRAYHLHWDDRADWPDPWQLLSDNIYCDLARGLGILYTITLIDRPDCQNAVLVEMDYDNLVLVDQGKYILNWDDELKVNTNLDTKSFRHSVHQGELKLQLY